MSRHLPTRPNLDYLKKEAKELLDHLQQRDPAAQLADAQHALAQEYGFASWPKLKIQVESLSPFAGKWTVNLAKSRPHPANRNLRSATLDIAVDGDSITIDDAVVDESGASHSGRNTIHADGREHTYDHGYAMTVSWRGRRVIETVATQRGAIVGRARYEVSPDGRTLSVSTDMQLDVFERSA